MAKGSNVGGAIIGSVLITLILVAAGGYFILPLIFPNLNENINEPVVLQSKSVEINNRAMINDTETNFALMNGTQMSITIENNSKISVSLGSFRMRIHTDTVGAVWFEISLIIVGIKNNTIPVEFYRSDSAAGYQEFTPQITINLVSNQLTNGTYHIAVYWRSLRIFTGYNFISSYMYDNYEGQHYNFIRTIIAQELR